MGCHKSLSEPVKAHACRVGTLARLAARALGKDERAAYLAGVFHDDGKAYLPAELFDGRDISEEEYEGIKEHARKGFLELKDRMPVTSLCSGLHHEMSKEGGYGISMDDIPKDISFALLKKILDLATIVAVADFSDAFLTRKTSLRVSDKKRTSLRDMLMQRFPDESLLVDTVVTLTEEIYTTQEESHEEDRESVGD